MRDYLLVLRAQVGVSWRRLGRGSRATGLLFLGAGLMAGFTVLITRAVVRMLSSLDEILVGYPGLLTMVEGNLLVMWSLFIITIVLSNALHTTYATLYGSEDTGFLLATPLHPRSVFAARLTGSMTGYVVVAIPTFGPFVAYGIARGAGFPYYVTVGVTYFAFLSLVVAAAALFITLVMAYVPGAKLKQWLMIFGLLLGLGVVFGSQYVASGVERGSSLITLLQRIAGFNLGGFPLLPHVWLARSAQEAATEAGGGVQYAAMTVALTAVAGLLVVRYASRVYVLGWAGTQESQRRRVRRTAGRRARNAAIRPGRSLLASPFWGVSRKDLLTSTRTPVMWYLVLVGAVVVAFQIVNMVRSRAGHPVDEGFRLLILGFVLGGASFSGSILAGSAFSREGGNLGLVQSWPASPATLFAAKVAAALPVPVMASLVGLGVVTYLTPVSFAPFWPYLPAVILTQLAMLSLMALLDSFFPDFSFEKGFEPGTRGSTGTVIKTLVSLYAGIGAVVLMVATLSFGTTYGRFAWAQSLTREQAQIIAYLAFALEGLVFIAGALALGSRRLAALAHRNVRRS